MWVQALHPRLGALFVPGIGSLLVDRAVPPSRTPPPRKPVTGACCEANQLLLAFPAHPGSCPPIALLCPCHIMCGPVARVAPSWARGCCGMQGTGLLLLTYLAYLTLGTCVFWALEGGVAQNYSGSFQCEKWELLKNVTCLDGPALDLLIRGARAHKDGAHLPGNTTSMGRWEFTGSFFFSVSTITTIGYGNLSPRTMGARLFCIFFALVGIPLNLVVLNRLSHLMQRPSAGQWLAGSAALLSGLLLFLVLPPLLFSRMEGWSYVESFYFSFITLSTVGFGDYVIGMDPSRKYPLWYKNFVSLWILFGMSWLALIIKVILSLLETPGDMGSCSWNCSKGHFEARSWRQAPEGEHKIQSSQPSCCFEGSEGITQHLEPSAQVTQCDKDG